MNTRYITRIIFTVCTVCMLNSCNKQLDLQPTDSIDPEKAFKTLSDINQGVLGAYDPLSYNNIYYNSLVSDEIMLPSENFTGSGFSTYRWQFDGSNTFESWNENYLAIDRANRVLAIIDDIPLKSGEEELKEQYKGELIALRAYCHFELIRFFASGYEPTSLGVPYMEKSEVSMPPRLSFAETMAKVDADLVTAKGLIPASFSDKSRITKAAIAAIQARAALYEKSWDNAITYATEAINAAPLASQSDFSQIWTDQGDEEVLWKLKMVSGDEHVGSTYNDEGYLTDPSATRLLYAASYELVNTFDQVNDVRFSSYIHIDPIRETAGKTPNIVIKWVGGDPDLSNIADIKLFRTGELYLIRAEAYAEKEKLAEGSADLNALRTARITGYADQAFGNKDALIDAITAERFKELAFEGHRMFDLRRHNLPVTREPNDAINALGKVLLTSDQAQYEFPIPDAELRANKNMVQNPKYN
jgi:hypothetical protein